MNNLNKSSSKENEITHVVQTTLRGPLVFDQTVHIK